MISINPVLFLKFSSKVYIYYLVAAILEYISTKALVPSKFFSYFIYLINVIISSRFILTSVNINHLRGILPLYIISGIVRVQYRPIKHPFRPITVHYHYSIFHSLCSLLTLLKTYPYWLPSGLWRQHAQSDERSNFISFSWKHSSFSYQVHFPSQPLLNFVIVYYQTKRNMQYRDM